MSLEGRTDQNGLTGVSVRLSEQRAEALIPAGELGEAGSVLFAFDVKPGGLPTQSQMACHELSDHTVQNINNYKYFQQQVRFPPAEYAMPALAKQNVSVG